ncbi:MAG TPA: RNA polymerase sigma factor, partial [bacterium]|nr:RNA polymerase sigma factor [bacterium]
KQIHRHANPQAYILRICASAALDLLRKRMRIEKRERPIDDSPLHGTEVLVSTKIHERETVRAIQGRIADLPKQQAEAVLLRAFEEQSFESIGRALGCSEATARSHVSKGLARLRTLLSAPEWGKEINQ